MALVAPSLAAPEKVTISICYHHSGEPWAKIMRATVDKAIAIFKSKMKELGLDVDVKVIELPIRSMRIIRLSSCWTLRRALGDLLSTLQPTPHNLILLPGQVHGRGSGLLYN